MKVLDMHTHFFWNGFYTHPPGWAGGVTPQVMGAGRLLFVTDSTS